MDKKPLGNNSPTLTDLHTRAEERLTQQNLGSGVSALSTTSSPEEMLRLVHELDVHQIELEMQQEELAKTRVEVEDSLARYTELYDFAPVGYLTLGRDSKIQQANLTSSNLLGVDRSHLLGLSLKQFVLPEDYRVIDHLLKTVFTERKNGYCEVKLLANAFQHPQLNPNLSSCTVRIEAGIGDAEDSCRVILIDICEQKNAENEQHRLTRILRATTLCNQALIHSTDEMELVQKICNIVVDIGGYRMAWIGYAEHNKEKSVRPIAQSGSEEGYLETVTISWADTEFGRGPTGTAIRTGKPITSIDIIHDPRMKQWRSQAIKHGYASSLSSPLKADHEVFGALSIYSSQLGAFNAEEIELLTALADNLAYGITMLRTREAKQRSEADLKQSEERFRKMFEEHSAIKIVFDSNTGNVSDANQSAADFYGWSIEKLRTMSVLEITNLSSEEFFDRMQQVRLSGKKQFLSQHRMADGSLRDVEVFTNAIEIGGKELFFSIIQDITEKKAGEKKIRDYVKQLEGAMKSTLQAVAKVVEAHDPYTSGHDCRVGIIAADIAREMGWNEETCQTMQLVGLVHDIGKMSIPGEILTKPGKLSAIEFEIVKTHAENGYQILKDVEFSLPIARIIREHHERMDGSGYPRGLKGENTRPESRILAVADVLEAMASNRPYRASLGIQAAISEIETHRGSLFDPDVVDAMLRLFREKGYHLPD